MKPQWTALVLVVVWPAVGVGDDWPQWRGPNRDGRSAETGLLKTWPQDGPKRLWSADGLGEGFGSLAIADGVIYTTGMDGGKGVLSAIGTDGRLRWRKPYGPEWTRSHSGTRTTPTVNDGRVYVMSAMGQLACFDARTGDRKWSVDTVENQGSIPKWGVAESVLVVGQRVICTPGNSRGSVIALDKVRGRPQWKCRELSDKSAYCSPILVTRGSTQYLITMVAKGIVCIDLDAGRLVWRHPHSTRHDVHANSPVYHDGRVYATSGYGTGGVMLDWSGGSRVRQVWRDPTMDTHYGGVVLVDGKIYGTRFRNGLICLDLESGKVDYEAQRVSKGAVIWAEDLLYVYSERGTVGLVRPTRSGFKLLGRLSVRYGGGPHWAHPAIADGRLYVRHGDAMAAFDIRAR